MLKGLIDFQYLKIFELQALVFLSSLQIIQHIQSVMSYRIRPSSKNSQQTDIDKVSQRSMVQLPYPRTFQPQMNHSMSNQQVRTLTIRVENMQNNVTNLQDLWRRQREVSNAGYLQVQKRLDLLEYKTFTTQKDVRQISQQNKSSSLKSSDNIVPDNLRASQNQISMLKQLLSQQKQTQRENQKYQAYQMQQISMKQMRLEQQLKQILNKKAQQNAYILQSKIQQLNSRDQLKSEKISSQYDMMKNMIATSQRKIISELQKKIRNQTIIKDYIEDKLTQLRQEMTIQQKTIISKQGKFIKQIKQSIQAVFTMAKNIRKQLNNQLEQTQKLAANNFKKLSMNVDLLKDKLYTQIKDIGIQTQELSNQMVDLKSFVNDKIQQNREMIMEIEEQTLQRSNSRGMGESAVDKQKTKITMDTSHLQKDLQNWKTMTQQKNLNVFKEISQALKTMKLEWKKQNDEITSLIGSYEENLSNVKKSVPLQMKKSIQAIITIFNNQFDTLAQQLDTITQMIALSKNQVQKAYKQDLKKSKEQIIKQVKNLLKTSENQINLQRDRSIKKSEQTQKLYFQEELNFLKNMLSQKQASLQTEIGQVSSSSKKNHLNTSNQLEDFTIKLKNFNENYKDYLQQQRKDDMKKRMQLQESMRKNSSNLMDVCYKKCEFLVQGMKQAIEMNNLKEKTTLKRDIQSLKEQSQKQMYQMRQNNQKTMKQIKDQNQRKIFQIKEDINTQFNQKIDKMEEQRRNNQEIMHQALDQQINNVKKSLSIQIGNSKLELTEKINQLVQSLNEIKSKGSDDTQQIQAAIQSVKEAIWKIQARSFAEQAKNKALMDRFSEDINDVSLNVTVLANQLNSKSKV